MLSLKNSTNNQTRLDGTYYMLELREATRVHRMYCFPIFKCTYMLRCSWRNGTWF